MGIACMKHDLVDVVACGVCHNELEEKLSVATSENRAIIDYNTIKENLEMERLQHGIEIKALEEKLKVAIEALDNIAEYPCDEYHHDKAKQALEVITKESE